MAYLSDGVDVDVVLGVLRVRHKGLDEEVPEDADDGLYLLLLARPLGYPCSGFGPGLVEGEQATLAAALDELVGLCDEAGSGSEQPRVGGLCLVEDGLDGGVRREVERGELRGRVVGVCWR